LGDRYFSIAAASIFEIVDLVVPYVIGQILNVLSGQPVDSVLWAIAGIANLTDATKSVLSLAVLLGLIFLVTVVRAPIQVWSSWWFHWGVLCVPVVSSSKISGKILTLPLEFYDDENNLDALPDELLEVLKTIPGLTRKWQDN